MDEDKKKNNTYTGALPSNGASIAVCRGFCLTTMGFTEANKDAVLAAVQAGFGEMCSSEDQRGRQPKGAGLEEVVKNHVWHFHPIKHHYRHEHAPYRYYLPADLTISSMHQDFIDRHDGSVTVSFETYRKVVRKMNISFTRFAGEECGKCFQ